MKRFYAVWLCAILFSSSLMAKQESHAQNSSPAPAKPAPQKLQPADYSQEPFIIEQYYTIARFENDGTSERTLAVRIRVQSDAGVQQLGELIFGYNSSNEAMDVRFVRVKKKDGSVVTASAARDAPEYTDYKEKHVTVPSLHSGDSIEYEISTRTVSALAPGNFWFDYAFVKHAITLDERLEVNLPAGRVHNFIAAPGLQDASDIAGVLQ